MPFVPLVPAAPVGPVAPVAPFVPFVPALPVGPIGPVAPVAPLLPNAVSKVAVDGVPVVVVTERRYEPGLSPVGSFATMVPVLELKLCTVSDVPCKLTIGVLVPVFVPTIVILFNA